MRPHIDWTQIDPDAHLNEGTQMIAYTLVDEYGEEEGMRILGVILEDLGGMRVDLHNPEKIGRELAKRGARRMLREGLTAKEIRRRTGLSFYMIRQIQRSLPEDVDADGDVGPVAGPRSPELEVAA